MELNVGDYARFDYHRISVPIQISKIKEKEIDKDEKYYSYLTDNGLVITGDNIIKSSPNIIDILEVGDYVNGLPVERIEGTLDDKDDIRVWFGVATYGKTALNQINHRYTVKDDFEDDYSLRFRCIKPDDIKSIITREQFEAMKYVVGEE